MNEFNPERPKPWSVYTSANTPRPSHTGRRGDPEVVPSESLETSLNAISFGFVATVILISMFIIMAIFEHLIWPKSTFLSRPDVAKESLELNEIRVQIHTLEKLGNSQNDCSVLIPGEECPTFIVNQLQPTLPCPKEKIYWRSHGHAFVST